MPNMVKMCVPTAVLLGVSAGAAIGSPSRLLVALSGDETLRNDGSLALMADFGAPSIGAAGDLYFGSRTQAGGLEGDAIFVPSSDAGLRAFASAISSGDAAPGTEDNTFDPVPNLQIFFSDRDGASLRTRASINASGGFASMHALQNTVPIGSFNVFSLGIWREDVGSLRDLTFTRRVGNIIYSPSSPILSDDGRTFFTNGADVLGSRGDSGRGLFVESNGVVEPVAQRGTIVPGTSLVLRGSLDDNVSVSKNGSVAFVSSYVSGSGEGLFAGPAESFGLIASRLDSAPGFGDEIFRAFGAPLINNAGDVFFYGFSRGESTFSHSLWRWRGGELGAIVTEGDAAPGVTGATFANMGTRSAEFNVLGGAGDAVFKAMVEGAGIDESNDTGLWIVTGDTIRPLALEGSDAPGTGGADFAELMNGVEPEETQRIASNENSNFAFLTRLQTGENGVIEGVNDLGLWAYDPAIEELLLIARTGDTIDLFDDGGDVRTIADIRFNHLYGLAENGRLGYTLLFDDGSSAVFSAVIPTPGAIAMLVCAPVVGRRRR